MKNKKVFFILFSLCCFVWCLKAQESTPKPRVFILTDMSNEPDDEESMVRFLVYSNEFDVEGLVATTSCFLRNGTREDLIRKQIAAYGLVRDNLSKHAEGFPLPANLEKITATGQPTYGMEAVGKDKASKGSQLLLEAGKKEENRPLWVCIWGGANTLAQALVDARSELSEEGLKRFISQLRIYSISDQDDAGPWIRKEFPDLFYIVDPSMPDHLNFYSATWNGISGDRQYGSGEYYHFNLVDNPWLEENIIKNHGPLGALYPRLAYIMEGDTPSFLGLINNGLGWTESPDFGGWGGRYKLYRSYGESRPIWTSNQESRDCFEYKPGEKTTSNCATIWRWRKHFQHDFAARMDWCVADNYEKANHNPIAVLNGDTSKNVLYIQANGRDKIQLSALGSRDPDGNEISIKWWIYPEAGSISTASLCANKGTSIEVDLSNVKEKKGSLHVIMQINDHGYPSLYAYRRAVIIL